MQAWDRDSSSAFEAFDDSEDDDFPFRRGAARSIFEVDSPDESDAADSVLVPAKRMRLYDPDSGEADMSSPTAGGGADTDAYGLDGFGNSGDGYDDEVSAEAPGSEAQQQQQHPLFTSSFTASICHEEALPPLPPPAPTQAPPTAKKNEWRASKAQESRAKDVVRDAASVRVTTQKQRLPSHRMEPVRPQTTEVVLPVATAAKQRGSVFRSRVSTLYKMASELETITSAKYLIVLVDRSTGEVFVRSSAELEGVLDESSAMDDIRELSEQLRAESQAAAAASGSSTPRNSTPRNATPRSTAPSTGTRTTSSTNSSTSSSTSKECKE